MIMLTNGSCRCRDIPDHPEGREEDRQQAPGEGEDEMNEPDDKNAPLNYETPVKVDRRLVILAIGVAIFVSVVTGIVALFTIGVADQFAILVTVGFWSAIISGTVAAGIFYGEQVKDFWT